jgi:hypothetical protein
MKVKMKNALISSIFSGWEKNENLLVFVTQDVIYGPLDTTWHLMQLELRL